MNEGEFKMNDYGFNISLVSYIPYIFVIISLIRFFYKTRHRNVLGRTEGFSWDWRGRLFGFVVILFAIFHDMLAQSDYFIIISALLFLFEEILI